MIGNRSFGDWLRQQRRALDLTQAELARQVGCSAITMRKRKAEHRRPSNGAGEAPASRSTRNRLMAAACQQSGDVTFTATWAADETASLATAIERALQSEAET